MKNALMLQENARPFYQPSWAEGWECTCEGCGILPTVDEHHFCSACAKKAARALRNQQVARGQIEPFFILAIGVSRAYGGPEEGGWWWDPTRIIAVRKVWTFRDGIRAAQFLREEHPTCPRGRGSVIGGEDVYIQVCRTVEDFPEEVQHAGIWE